MQPAELFIHVDQTGRNARKPAVPLIGGIGDVHRIGHRLEKGLKAAFNLTLFGQLVEFLLRLDNLFARLGGNIHLRGLCRDVTAKLDQIAAHSEVIDHLRIVAHCKGADRGARKTGEIGRAAEFFQPFIVFHEGLERDRGGEVVLGDPLGRDIEDPRMDRLVEMLWPNDRGDAVIDVVVGQNGAQQLLFSLNRMRHRFRCLYSQLVRVQRSNLVHDLTHIYPDGRHNQRVCPAQIVSFCGYLYAQKAPPHLALWWGPTSTSCWKCLILCGHPAIHVGHLKRLRPRSA